MSGAHLEAAARARVVAAALSWLGTPYHDNAELKGVGVDCARLLKCVFAEAGAIADFPIADYPPQWYLHRSEERLLGLVQRRAVEIAESAARPGDVVLYRFGRCFAHGAIVVDPGWPRIVHAYRQAGCVVIGEGDQGDLGALREIPAERGKPRPRRFFTCRDWSGLPA